jgi:hypothetical protein
MRRLARDSARSWGARNVHLDWRMSIAARVRTSSPFALLLTQTDDPPWVAARVRLDEHLAVIRVAFYDKNEESGEEGEKKKGPDRHREGRRRGEVRPDHRGRE